MHSTHVSNATRDAVNSGWRRRTGDKGLGLGVISRPNVQIFSVLGLIGCVPFAQNG
jgi:hypothetical protein